jgi:hypothetical protein
MLTWGAISSFFWIHVPGIFTVYMPLVKQFDGAPRTFRIDLGVQAYLAREDSASQVT